MEYFISEALDMKNWDFRISLRKVVLDFSILAALVHNDFFKVFIELFYFCYTGYSKVFYINQERKRPWLYVYKAEQKTLYYSLYINLYMAAKV